MTKTSAGIMLYKLLPKENLAVFLCHNGGPYFKDKLFDNWSIPKGEQNNNETLEECAIREFQEETGIDIPKNTKLIYLGSVNASNNSKTIHVFAADGSNHPDTISIKSNTFELEYPKGSGKIQKYPELDEGAWFDLYSFSQRINPKYEHLVDKLYATLKQKQLLLP